MPKTGMNDSTKEYEDALADVLSGALQAGWKHFDRYREDVTLSRAETIRVTTELILFPLAYSTSVAQTRGYRLQAGLLMAGQIYLRGLTNENDTVDLCDCVLSSVEREAYQTEIRRNFPSREGDLSQTSYRVLLFLMTEGASTRCGDDVVRAARTNPAVDRKETLMLGFRNWGETLTKRVFGSGAENTFKYQTSVSRAAAMLGASYFYLVDRLPK